MLYFQECNVTINGTGLVCEAAQIDSKNSLTPIYVLGKKGTISQSPNGSIENVFNINYYIDLKREPSYGISNQIKTLTDDGSYSGVAIAVGGITGRSCFLNSYSFSVQPNDLIRANATYTSFRPLIGNLAFLSGDYYNTIQTLGHAWTTYALSTGNVTSLPVYKLDYNFQAEWKPTYTISRPYPVQVNLMSASEEISVLIDRYYDIRFSGESPMLRLFSGGAINDSGIKVSGLAVLCTGGNLASGSGYAQSFGFENVAGMVINISGFRISNVNINAQVDDFVNNRTTFKRYY